MPTGGSKTQTTKQENTPWAGAIPGLEQAAAGALSSFNQGMPAYYPGQTVAGINKPMSQGIQGIQRNAGNASQYADMGANTLQDMMGGGPNPYLGKLFDIGQRDISNDVNAQFSKAGRYGSGAQTDVLSRNMGDLWTQMAGGAYENDQNRRLAATDRLAGMYDLSQQGNKDLLGVGGIKQAQAQNEIDANKAKWDYEAGAGRNNVNWLADVASQLGNVGGTQTATGLNPNYKSAGDNLMGLGTSLGAAWLMSDRRLKTDIELLGADEFGLNWYAYRYVWDEPGAMRIGVMADEAPAHAVAHDASGFSMVDYGAL